MRKPQWLVLFAGILGSEATAADCLKEQRRLPSEHGLGGKVHPAAHSLHVHYNDWDTLTFERTETNPTAFRAKAGLSTGSIIYGESYVTGRQCHLHMMQIMKPTHTFDAATKVQVQLELQLHHICESLALFEDEEDGLQKVADAMKRLKAKLSSLFAKYQRIRESHSGLSDTEVDAAERQEKTEIESDIAARKPAMNRLQQIKHEKKYEMSGNRPDLSENVILVVPLTFEETNVQEELNTFLQALLNISGESKSVKLNPSSMIAQLGPAMMYNGTSLEVPCGKYMDWFVLTSNSALPTSTYDLIMRLLEDHVQPHRIVSNRDHTSAWRATDLVLAQVDNKYDQYLARPKYTPAEEGHRALAFFCMISGVIAFGALWHAVNPDGELTAMLFYGFSAKNGPRFDHQKPIRALFGNEPSTDEDPFSFDLDFFMTIGSIAILVLLATIGYAFIPGDLFTSEPFGLWKAMEALRFDLELLYNVLTLCGLVALLLLQVLFYSRCGEGLPAMLYVGFCFVLDALTGLVMIFGASWHLGPWESLLDRAQTSIGFSLLCASCVIPFLGVPVSILPAMATSGASLLLGAVMLCLYKLPGLAGPFGSWWVSFVAYWPIASFIVRVTWRGIPILMTTLVAPWLTLSLGSAAQNGVSCVDGVDWEVHFAFAFVICTKSMLWLLFYQHEHSAFARVTTYVFYVMAELDMYTDAMFIALATTCGTWYGYAAFLTYAGGVVALQLCIPTVFIGASQGQSGQVGAMWNLLLFPIESAPRTRQKKGYYVPLDEQLEINEWDAKRQVLIVMVLRVLGQDLPQCVLQYLFTINVKKVPFIMFSITISVTSSVFALAKTFYNYSLIRR